MATPFDNKIFWIHWMGRSVGEQTMDELIQTVKRYNPNVSGIAVKTSDGEYWQGRYDDDNDMAVNGPEDILRWGKALARNGLQLYLWCVIRGDNVAAESQVIATACRTRGVRAMLLDVEGGRTLFWRANSRDSPPID